jgi:uncharacterized surface protein with fasciclin (FAS1) repeats
MTFLKSFRFLMVAVVAGSFGAALVASPAAAQGSTSTSKQTIYKIASTNDDFSTLATAVKAAGLKKALSGKDKLTVFAPTDDAFAQVPSDALDSLLADKDALSGLLTYHVISGKVPSSKLMPTQTVASLNGEEFTINVSDGAATIVDGAGNTINITTTDIKAKNGVIHVIDAVMSPAAS